MLMRMPWWVFMVVTVVVLPGVAWGQSERFYLPKGTPVPLKIVSRISSETANIGDPVSLQVTEDVKVDGIVLIPKGTKTEGFVSEVMSSKFWGAGRLRVYVGSVRTRTGLSVPVHGELEAYGGTAEAVIAEQTPVVAVTDMNLPLEKSYYTDSNRQAATN
jgi:hypothetical protein